MTAAAPPFRADRSGATDQAQGWRPFPLSREHAASGLAGDAGGSAMPRCSGSRASFATTNSVACSLISTRSSAVSRSACQGLTRCGILPASLGTLLECGRSCSPPSYPFEQGSGLDEGRPRPHRTPFPTAVEDLCSSFRCSIRPPEGDLDATSRHACKDAAGVRQHVAVRRIRSRMRGNAWACSNPNSTTARAKTDSYGVLLPVLAARVQLAGLTLRHRVEHVQADHRRLLRRGEADDFSGTAKRVYRLQDDKVTAAAP